MKHILTFLKFIVAGVLIALLNVWVLSLMWGWFLTPVFHVSVPSYSLLYGLTLIATFFLHVPDTKPLKEVVIARVSKSLIYLLFAWIVHAFFV